MDYTTIIKDLARCDGKNGTCKTCTYKEHPACREAMAREAAAVLNLQGVRLKISTEMTGKVLVERNEALKMVQAYMDHKDAVDVLIARLFGDLAAMRHCVTCKHNRGDEGQDDEVCQSCMYDPNDETVEVISQWEPKDRYTTIDKPGETEEQPPVEDVIQVSDE